MLCKERGYHLQPLFTIICILHFMPMRDWSKMTWIEVWMLSLHCAKTSIISLLLSTLESIGTTVIAYVGIVWVHVLSWWQVDCLLKATTRPTSLQLAFGSERLRFGPWTGFSFSRFHASTPTKPAKAKVPPTPKSQVWSLELSCWKEGELSPHLYLLCLNFFNTSITAFIFS